MSRPANSGQKQARRKNGTFAKGSSGNPAGKPPGTRHRTTQAAEVLLDGEAEALTAKAVQMALEGDTVALRLCLERIVAPRRDRPVSFSLPASTGLNDHPKAIEAIMSAVAVGDLTPIEAEGLVKIIELHRRAIETADLEERLAALERKYGA